MEQSQNCRITARAATLEMGGVDGRHQPFEVVVLPHLAAARRLARRVTRDAADADDVMQEATVRLLCFLGNYRGGDARSWVLRVTRNTAFTWMRRNRRPHLQSALDEISEEAPPPLFHDACNDPFIIEARRAESDLLNRAIHGLPPQQREIVILRDLNGLPYAEIASALGIPIGTVMSRLSRTHGALKRRLAHLNTSRGGRQYNHSARSLTPT